MRPRARSSSSPYERDCCPCIRARLLLLRDLTGRNRIDRYELLFLRRRGHARCSDDRISTAMPLEDSFIEHERLLVAALQELVDHDAAQVMRARAVRDRVDVFGHLIE